MVLTLESIARGHSTPTSSSHPWRTETTTQLGWAFVVGATLGVFLEVVGVGIVVGEIDDEVPLSTDAFV
jgi:hypothetical protein